VQAWLTIESDEEAFHVTAKRELTKNGQIVRSKAWEEAIERNQV
jgi:hypothetical protein